MQAKAENLSLPLVVDSSSYLFTRNGLGNTAALFLMLGIMLPAFLLAMYEKDGLPPEKVVKNITALLQAVF